MLPTCHSSPGPPRTGWRTTGCYSFHTALACHLWADISPSSRGLSELQSDSSPMPLVSQSLSHLTCPHQNPPSATCSSPSHTVQEAAWPSVPLLKAQSHPRLSSLSCSTSDLFSRRAHTLQAKEHQRALAAQDTEAAGRTCPSWICGATCKTNMLVLVQEP